MRWASVLQTLGSLKCMRRGTRLSRIYDLVAAAARRRARDGAVIALPCHVDEVVDAEGDQGQHHEQHDDNDGDNVVFLHGCGSLLVPLQVDSFSELRWQKSLRGRTRPSFMAGKLEPIERPFLLD